MTSTATVSTPKASLCLKQLCRHFAHKVDATFDDNDGRISFSFGVCELHADDTLLRLTAKAPDREAHERVEQVIADHFERFAHREGLSVTWPGGGPSEGSP